ncbi:MAG: hypothetical protein QXG45_02420 [Nitrososphaerota archaeon]
MDSRGRDDQMEEEKILVLDVSVAVKWFNVIKTHLTNVKHLSEASP